MDQLAIPFLIVSALLASCSSDQHTQNEALQPVVQAPQTPKLPSQQPNSVPISPQNPNENQPVPALQGKVGNFHRGQVSFSEGLRSSPVVALTFDDGPEPTLTPRLLDILKKQGIKATFFVVGKNAAAYPNIIRRIVNEGHEIGNHSWSHPLLSKYGEARVRAELSKTHDAIVAACGVAPTVFRPPYGGLTKNQGVWISKDYGYSIIIWDVDPLDWRKPGSSVVQSRIVSQTKNGSIILSHDIHAGTIAAMDGTISKLKERGFQFETVSGLLAPVYQITGKPGVSADQPAATPVPQPVAPATHASESAVF